MEHNNVTIEKETGNLSGLYSITINNNTELFDQNDFNQLRIFTEMQGYSGHGDLHEWIKKKRGPFFERYIKDGDHGHVVMDILIALQRWFNTQQ
jgi:hypothetical protein